MCTLRLNYVHTFTSISQNFTRSAKYTAWIIEQPPKIWQPQPLFLNFKAPIPHLTIVVIFRKPPIHIAWCAVSHVDTEPRLIPSRKARNTINIKITRKKLTIITWENSAHHEAWQEKLLLLVYHFVRFFFLVLRRRCRREVFSPFLLSGLSLEEEGKSWAVFAFCDASSSSSLRPELFRREPKKYHQEKKNWRLNDLSSPFSSKHTSLHGIFTHSRTFTRLLSVGIFWLSKYFLFKGRAFHGFPDD